MARFFAIGDIPEVHGPVGMTGGDQLAVRRKSYRACMGRAVAELKTFLSGPDIPDAARCTSVLLRARKPAAVGRESEFVEIAVLIVEPLDFANLPAAGQVPQSDGMIAAARSQSGAVRRDSQRQHRGGVPLDLAQAFPRLAVPQMDEVIVTARDHRLA